MTEKSKRFLALVFSILMLLETITGPIVQAAEANKASPNTNNRVVSLEESKTEIITNNEEPTTNNRVIELEEGENNEKDNPSNSKAPKEELEVVEPKKK